MKSARIISAFLVAPLLALGWPASVSADVTSMASGERLFVRVTTFPEPAPVGMRIRFEQCELEAPEGPCTLLGQGDYLVRDLVALRAKLLKRAEKAGAFGVRGVLGTILATLGGGAAGALAGGIAGAAAAGNAHHDPLDAVGGFVAGAAIGFVVAGTAIAIFTVKKIKKSRREKKAALLAQAALVMDPLLADEPVRVDADIQTFGRQLGAVLTLAKPVHGAGEPVPQALP